MPPGTVAVIFTSKRTNDVEGYDEMSAKMVELAAEQDGFVAVSSFYDETRQAGITVSYWRHDAAAKAWKEVAEHLVAQQLGRERWYSEYQVVVAEVTRSYDYNSPAC